MDKNALDADCSISFRSGQLLSSLALKSDSLKLQLHIIGQLMANASNLFDTVYMYLRLSSNLGKISESD